MNAATAPLRVVFAGTPDFAVPPLRALVDSGRPPIAVYTQPDRPAGRGRRLQSGPVKQLAGDAGIEVRQPVTLRDDDVRAGLAALEPDLLVVVAYGLILPRSVLELPTHGCWNIHASLLPRWRGAAPIQRALAAGDEETGICIMRMEVGLDTGPVLLRRAIPIRPGDTAGSLHDRLAPLGAAALVDCLEQLERGELPPPEPQDASAVTHAPKLTKDEARLDFTRPAVELERQVRAFDPWPVAWTTLAGERLRVWRAAVVPPARAAEPGTVIAAGPAGIDIATGGEALRLVEVQRAGGRRVAAGDFLNAHPLEVGVSTAGG